MTQENKITVNGTLYDYICAEVHFKKNFGAYIKDLYLYYRLFCAAKGVSPMLYRDFRDSMQEVLGQEMPEAEFTRKNNRYFINNVVHGLTLKEYAKA